MNLNPLQEIEELKQKVEHLPNKVAADLLRVIGNVIRAALIAKADEYDRS